MKHRFQIEFEVPELTPEQHRLLEQSIGDTVRSTLDRHNDPTLPVSIDYIPEEGQ